MGSEMGSGVFSSMTAEKKSKEKSFCKVSMTSRNEPSEAEEGNRALDLQKLLLLVSKSLTDPCEELQDKGCEMRERMLSSGSELKGFLKNTRKRKFMSDRLRQLSPQNKVLTSEKTEEDKKLEFQLLFKASFLRDPSVEGTVFFQNLSEKLYLAFLLGLKYCNDNSEWKKLRKTLGFYPQKLSQGLINLGNTCYMNAVLQALFSIPSFAEDLLNHSFYWSSADLNAFNMCMTELLIIKDVDIIKVKKLLLKNIKRKVSAVASSFYGNTENDAYEFLSHCLDLMQRNKGKLSTVRQRKTESEEENSPQQVFADSAATNLLACPVISNFEFEVLFSLTCKECSHIVHKTEVCNSLSINIPSKSKALPVSIQSAFDYFFEPEELEYKCEKCKCNYSLAKHKFSRLPRILIVHLKRYTLNKFYALSKDDQKVAIPRYLMLSSHCSENIKSPIPLSKNAHSRESQIFKLFDKTYSELISSLTPSTNLTSASQESLAPHIGSDKESEPQKHKMPCKGSSSEQQQTGPGTKPSTVEFKLTNSGDGAVPEEKLLAADLMMNLENTFASLKLENEGKPSNDPDASLAEVPPEEILANPKEKRDEKGNECVDFETVSNSTENFSEDKKNRIIEEFQKVAEQIQQSKRVRLYKQTLQLALLQSLPNPNAQGCTENLRTPKTSSLQKANVKSVGALGSNEKPGKKDVKETEPEPKAKEHRRNTKVKDSHAYQLIAVVSHLGDTSSTGHYISDAYDFERQRWFTYNDTHVSRIRKDLMQEARLRTGYVFFYMHNKIFEELLEREKNSQCGSKKAEGTPQKK
ncbi:Ubiquitin carboxyl-terminal hydrolase 26 [Manis javanica]|nr:Ubiquitin carboxyl-terminal hydrolase 26 [Manis javanica]